MTGHASACCTVTQQAVCWACHPRGACLPPFMQAAAAGPRGARCSPCWRRPSRSSTCCEHASCGLQGVTGRVASRESGGQRRAGRMPAHAHVCARAPSPACPGRAQSGLSAALMKAAVLNQAMAVCCCVCKRCSLAAPPICWFCPRALPLPAATASKHACKQVAGCPRPCAAKGAVSGQRRPPRGHRLPPATHACA